MKFLMNRKRVKSDSMLNGSSHIQVLPGNQLAAVVTTKLTKTEAAL